MKNKTNKHIQVRVTEYEKNRIKWLADKYAGGNVSLLIVYASLNIARRKIKPSDIKKTSNRKKRDD